MNFHILTLFPEMITAGLSTSIMGRAQEAGNISVEAINIRDFTKDVHRHVDDYPYGGGAGMIMQVQPIYDAYRSITERLGKKPRVLYTSPAGRVFNQDFARELAGEADLIILCGHYEGVDQRALELLEAEEVSIGDYVLTGGELPAMVMTDAISRMVPGVLTNEESGVDESFSHICPTGEFTRRIRNDVYGDLQKEEDLTLLEYPQYTRPEVFEGLAVPAVLLSGNHLNIGAWRRKQAIARTRERRPDLLDKS